MNGIDSLQFYRAVPIGTLPRSLGRWYRRNYGDWVKYEGEKQNE